MLKFRQMGLAGLLVSALLMSPLGFAKGQAVKLSLSHIEKIKTTEESGDELYFSVTEYSSVERPRQITVPSFPTYWLSKHLSNVNDVVLWEKELADKESVMLVISLIERDAPPWNVDDLIGTVKLKISNDHGKLKRAWSIPNAAETKRLDDNKNEFQMTGDGGDYKLSLQVEQEKEVSVQKAR